MKIKLEKTRTFWLYIVGGLIGALIGVVLLPAWAEADVFFSSWGGLCVNVMISGVILAYILLYLVKRINRYSGTPAQIVAIVELVLMAVLAVVCAVTDFIPYDVSFGGPCQIFGIALWVRGASGVYTGYYCDSNIVKAAEKEKKAQKKGKNTSRAHEEIDTDEEPRGRIDDFTVWRLTLAIALISLGTYLFVKPAFEKVHLQWVFSCAIILVSAFFVVFGFALKPKKIKVAPTSAKGKDSNTAAADIKEQRTEIDNEKQESLEKGKVSIKLDESANAMTKTAAYDAVKEEKTENLPALTEK